MCRSLRISHVEFRFPGTEKLGPSRNGRMERNFPVILIFRNFRPTSRGTPKISENVCFICSTTRKFWSNGKRPEIRLEICFKKHFLACILQLLKCHFKFNCNFQQLNQEGHEGAPVQTDHLTLS